VLIDANNYHLFQPLLYQVATAGLDAEDIAAPARGIFHHQPNVEFRMAEVPNAAELLELARNDAALVLQRDPGLTTERGEALRRLLYLFDCDEAVRLFRSG